MPTVFHRQLQSNPISVTAYRHHNSKQYHHKPPVQRTVVHTQPWFTHAPNIRHSKASNHACIIAHHSLYLNTRSIKHASMVEQTRTRLVIPTRFRADTCKKLTDARIHGCPGEVFYRQLTGEPLPCQHVNAHTGSSKNRHYFGTRESPARPAHTPACALPSCQLSTRHGT